MLVQLKIELNQCSFEQGRVRNFKCELVRQVGGAEKQDLTAQIMTSKNQSGCKPLNLENKLLKGVTERFSFECRKVIGFAFATLHDWLKKFAPIFHPIRSKNQNQS